MMEANDFYSQYLNIPQPYYHQIEVWKKFKEFYFPLLIRAPTGSGKTESIVAPFLSQFIENKFVVAPRLIYVLPTRVLINSIGERIKKYAKKISENIKVGVQHGELPNSPFFIDEIIVTTLDQFVYAYVRTSRQVGRHLDIPAGAIASSIVVFDEAHMYRDGFTFSIMRAIFEILYKSNIPFVVMTATMPNSLEESLFENIELNEDNKINVSDFNLNNQIDILIEEKPIYRNGEVEIPDKFLEEIKDKKSLIVLNQVKRAQKVYEYIKRKLKLGNNEIVLLHSRFTWGDRREHEKTALKLIKHKENGKLIEPEGTGIVVSTQVLEAGIDFSAELLLTELAPADSLIQRVGRCARYENEKGGVIIFPVETEKGHLPYEEKHLENTLNWLKKHRSFNIRNFFEASEFVNVLDYKADDYAAKDSLIDLYESVLYADSKPQNIQVREGKPVNLLVVEEKEEADITKDAIKKSKYMDSSFTVDIRIAQNLLKKGLYLYEWNWEEKAKKIDKQNMVIPFKTYILSSIYYDPEIGVKNDESIII